MSLYPFNLSKGSGPARPLFMSKFASLSVLFMAEVAGMSLWFVSSAILPDLLLDQDITELRQALLTSAVQAGFVAGALAAAFFGIADRYDPRKVFMISALVAGLFNLSLLFLEPGSNLTIIARFATGALMAGIYPVGMKITVGWGLKDRGFLVGSLVAALTLGSALPHLFAYTGGADWQLTVILSSLAAILGGFACLFTRLGPHHQKATGFDPNSIGIAWTNKKVRLAYAGYFGHMWELYGMWAWIGTAVAVSYAFHLPEPEAVSLAKITAFLAIAVGALACVIAGLTADKIGKARVAAAAMVFSALSALGTAFTFSGPVWLTFTLVMIWGFTVIPDSAQFSALVADASPPDKVGSLMTLQTALGFLLTFFVVQAIPVIAQNVGWAPVLAALAIGPIFGVLAMIKHGRLPS